MVYNELVTAIERTLKTELPNPSFPQHETHYYFFLSIVTGLSLIGCKKPSAVTKGEEDDKGIEDIVAIPVKVAAAKSGPILILSRIRLDFGD